MATQEQEFYIRNESETESRGPFTIEQLISLAEAGQVTDATLCYDSVTEQWTPLSSNESLKAAIFPEKNKLTLKKDVKVTTLNTATVNAAAITVDDMLAAAEGRTADTKDKSDPRIAMARAAKVGMWSCVATLFICAAGELLPAAEIISSLDWKKMLTQPLVILGAIDIILAVFLGMGLVSTYPFVRFRAALGFGFLGFIFYTQGHQTPLAAAAIGSAGLYVCTILTDLLPVLLAALLGFLGMAGVTYYLLSI